MKFTTNEKKMTFQVQFYLRRHNEKKGTVYCHISLNRKRTKKAFSTGIHCPPSLWDKHTKEIAGNRHEEENLMLLDMKKGLFQLFFEFEKKEVPFTAEDIKLAYLHGHGAEHPLLEVHDRWYKYQESQVGISIRSSTLRLYRLRFNLIRAYLLENKMEDFPLEAFAEKQAKRMADVLKEQGRSHNYVMRVVRQISTLQRWAKREQLIKVFPLEHFQYNITAPKIPEFLTPDKIQLVDSHRFFSKTLHRVAETLLVQCYTSMDYADLASFEWDKHTYINTEGELWIQKQRQKARLKSTHQIMNVPIFPNVLKIFKTYDYRLPIWDEKRQRTMSYDKYNKYLKEIGEILGLEIRMTTKTGRKTFINLMYEKGLPLEDISDMVGHNTTKITRSTYLRYSTKRISMNMTKAFGEAWAG